MSYILEALKKAERKQEEQEQPKTLLLSAAAVHRTDKRPLWLYPLFGVLLLNAGIMIWWLAPWRSVHEVSRPASPAAVSGPTETASSATDRLNQKVPTAPGPVHTNGSDIKPISPKTPPESFPTPQKKASETPSPVPSREPRELTPSPAKPVATATVSPEPKVRIDRPPQGTQKVYALNELPPTVKSALPEFRITGHAFSPEPQTRVVRINDRILQEGQDLTPGLKLEEIVAGGVILSYEGYRFRVNLGLNQ